MGLKSSEQSWNQLDHPQLSFQEDVIMRRLDLAILTPVFLERWVTTSKAVQGGRQKKRIKIPAIKNCMAMMTSGKIQSCCVSQRRINAQKRLFRTVQF